MKWAPRQRKKAKAKSKWEAFQSAIILETSKPLLTPEDKERLIQKMDEDFIKFYFPTPYSKISIK